MGGGYILLGVFLFYFSSPRVTAWGDFLGFGEEDCASIANEGQAREEMIFNQYKERGGCKS